MMDGLSRTLMTVQCPDCSDLPKCTDAGRVVTCEGQAVQIMHNGLRVVAGGYHGEWMSHVIRALRGHHEPQEELIFNHLVRFVRHGSVIVELGSHWAYYTLWYLNEVPGSRGFCVEPDLSNMQIGQRNAALNNLCDRIRFHDAWIGGRYCDAWSSTCETTRQARTLPCFDMAAVEALCSNSFIELLHIDAQGVELDFLRSARQRPTHLRFVMVSTHHASISGSLSTHTDCKSTIEALGGQILLEFDVHESFSGDGLILASFLTQDRLLAFPPITRNKRSNSLFG